MATSFRKLGQFCWRMYWEGAEPLMPSSREILFLLRLEPSCSMRLSSIRPNFTSRLFAASRPDGVSDGAPVGLTMIKSCLDDSYFDCTVTSVECLGVRITGNPLSETNNKF